MKSSTYSKVVIATLIYSLLLVSPAVFGQAERYVDGATGVDAGNDCSSAINPCATITHALDEASEGDSIAIAAGTYTEALTIERDVTLIGSAVDEVIIQANEEPGTVDQRVIFVELGNRLEVRDLTIRHGAELAGTGTGRLGGAIYVEQAELVLTRVVLTLNEAENRGGAIYNEQGSVVMTEVELSHNSSGRGGALYNNGGTLTMTQVDFNNNNGDGRGGALSNVNDGSVVGVNIEFRGNQGPRGGAMYSGGIDSTVELTNVTFTGNHATEFGGGMANVGSSSVLANAVFSANRTDADGQGGGFYNQGTSASATIANTIFWNNQDETGTGTRQASLFKSATSDIFITHSLVQGCMPSGEGWNDDCGTDSGNNLEDQNPQFSDPIGPGSAPNASGYFRQAEGSPVINRGDNSFVTEVSTDIDGFARIIDGTVDLGPYEFGSDLLIFRDRFEP